MSEKKKYAGQDKEDPDCIKRARDARFAATGEPKLAPGPDDQNVERALTASKGSKSSK
jgi:hypothetical protein